MTRKKYRPTIGSISEGTVNPDDLIPAFARELRRIRGALPKAIYTGMRELDDGRGGLDHDELAAELVQELSNALQDEAPPYFTFGAHHGDGADFGFWFNSESLAESVRDGTALSVSDLSKVPKGHTGEVVHVNDHGNTSLYVAQRGRLREVWAIV